MTRLLERPRELTDIATDTPPDFFQGMTDTEIAAYKALEMEVYDSGFPDWKSFGLDLYKRVHLIDIEPGQRRKTLARLQEQNGIHAQLERDLLRVSTVVLYMEQYGLDPFHQ